MTTKEQTPMEVAKEELAWLKREFSYPQSGVISVLELLIGEVERLKSESEVLVEHLGSSERQYRELNGNLTAANARAEWLRLALERIASGETGTEPFPHRNLDRDGMIRTAQQALADDAKGGM